MISFRITSLEGLDWRFDSDDRTVRTFDDWHV